VTGEQASDTAKETTMSIRMRLASAALATLVCVGTASAQPPGPRGPGPRGPGAPSLGREDQALADLKLPGEQNVKAQRVLDAQQEAARKALDQARTDLVAQMKDVLTAAQLRDFRDAVDRGPRGPGGPGRPGGGRGGPPGRFGRAVTTNDLVERIMAFDKQKTGKVTKEDLPERMQHLVDLGDTNRDGALDRDEVKNLAARIDRQGQAFGGRGPASPARALADLELTGDRKEKAQALVDAHQTATRKLLDQSRTELLAAMKDVLSDEQVKQFKDAIERRARGPFGRGPVRD
jgi:Spy/CpxP family protein refolding chaperone